MKADQEKRSHEIIKSIVFSAPEMFFVSSGGTDTHVHVILYSKSTITVAQMAKLMKGGSSEMINQQRLYPLDFPGSMNMDVSPLVKMILTICGNMFLISVFIMPKIQPLQ
ncbi:hypothetical protein ACFL27_28235, partial [candidate division CSSED10-310 bacterium]